MVAFDVYVLVNETFILARVCAGIDTGEFPKITYQVRLVKVAALRRDTGPIGLVYLPVDDGSRPLKSLHAAKQLWRDTYFRFKNLDKTSLAQAQIFCDFPDLCVRFPAEYIKS